MSLKTWASREVPQASNIGELLAQWATCLYSIYIVYSLYSIFIVYQRLGVCCWVTLSVNLKGYNQVRGQVMQYHPSIIA